jgi:hypothetical protein
MLKKCAAVLAVVFALGCASTATKQTAAETGGSSQSIAATRLYATDYILLSDTRALRPIDDSSSVYPLHIRGTLTNRGFMPVGNIQGHGKLCTGNDWLSVADQKVYKAGEGTPVAPYVLGCANGNGGFTPASREIVMP